MLIGQPYAVNLIDYFIKLAPFTKNDSILKEMYESLGLNSLALPVSQSVPFAMFTSASATIDFVKLLEVKFWD